MGINSFPPTGGAGGYEFPSELIDPVSKFRISQPENLIDTDFEYGLQPTKWETVELINNTPSFFSKSGDTTIDGISSIITNAGTREIIVKTELDHGLAVGIPINVTGTKSITADGSYIINSIPDTKTFTYLCKDDQDETASILDLYSSIITGEFFQGSQLRVSDSEGIVTDAEGTSNLTVTTNSTHGFGIGTPFYFLNLNSTVAQEFQAANTASKTFDASNSATAQTFDGSNTLSSFNVDWSNSATQGGTVSTITSTDTGNSRITVAHTTENFSGLPLGAPLYYSVSAVSGYFQSNPRGVVFLKTTTSLGTSSSTFQVSLVPDGEPILFTTALSGTFQIANQARTFAGNNINPLTQTVIDVEVGASFNFDGGNQGYTGAVQGTPPNNTLTISSYSGTTISATGADAADYYVGAMVRYSTTGTAATGLVNNTTYFVKTVTNNGGGSYSLTLSELPGASETELTISGGTGTQTLARIGISIDKDIVHIPSSNFSEGDMIQYTFPTDGRFDVENVEQTKLFYFVDTAYDSHNYLLSEESGFKPVIATGGTILPEVFDRGRTWKVHLFTTVGNSTFTVTSPGTEGLVEYLVIGGGGGGGGGDGGSGGGGGGAGGYRSSVFGELTGGGGAAESPLEVTAQSYTVTVGAAGLGRVSSTGWTNGGNSVFGPITAVGGGRGGHQANYAGSSGGSGGGGGGGGGGGVEANTGGARSTSPVQGFAGGNGGHVGGTALGGGGGGGAGSVGSVWDSVSAGNGGDGLVSRITGVNVTRAAGGGGSQNTNTGNRIPGLGGVGGGGNGAYTFNAVSGVANTGSGGGGGSHPNGPTLGSGADGGSGIVVVRYPITAVAPVAPTASGGTLGSVIVGDTTYRTHTFTNIGTSTFTVTNPGNLGPFDVLIVAGGGSGGVDNGGGAGGGGVIQTSLIPSATSYNIVVGAGGAARLGTQDDGPGNPGQNSSAFGLTALGGGGGSGWENPTLPPGGTNNGGSGAGQSSSNSRPNPSIGPGLGLQPGSASGGFGNRGGFSISQWSAGGGGARGYGSHSIGGTAVAGGLGYLPTVNFGAGLGVNGRFGAGGSGAFDWASGARASQTFSNNGVAKQFNQAAEAATPANTGGGGHGANHNDQTSGAGGSGIVIIRYPFSIAGLT